MILCVCPSPAVDVTYRVATLVAGSTNRVRDVAHRPGGKAVNVARVLHRLGADPDLVLPLGGAAGDELATALTDLGLRSEAVAATRATRRTVTVVEPDDTTTVLSEPAHVDCWDELIDLSRSRAAGADVVVISGSLPSDAPAHALAPILDTGVPTIVDTSGAALADALQAQATFIKPNADELTELTGERDPLIAATGVATRHGVNVVVSLGPEGLIAVTGAGIWHARPERPLEGNPTGAGDAAVAGLAIGLSRKDDLPNVLADAVALAGAAVLHPYAGDVDPDDVRTLRTGVTVTRLDTDGVS